MNRDLLIQQVKSEYARLAQAESRDYITNQSYSPISPEAYYEKTLEKVIRDISEGKYDDCVSGLQVVERNANHRTKAERIQGTIESTLHNMEIAEEKMDLELSSKKAQNLKSENERRAEAIPQMIRKMKEEQAQEELNSNSPNVIGGGGNG